MHNSKNRRNYINADSFLNQSTSFMRKPAFVMDINRPLGA